MRNHHPSGRALVAGALLLGTSTLLAQAPVGQWDFNSGDLTGTGGALAARDGVGAGLQYGTTTALGIPGIGGAEARVVKIPAGADASAGLTMPVAAAANANGFLVNDYTLVMDVLFPAASAGKLRGVLETDEFVYDPDAEVFVNAANAFGTKAAAFGAVTADTWHRLGIVVDANDDPGAANGQIRFYINGTEVGSANVANLKDQRYALNPGGTAGLFTDDTGETAEVFVNSIQLRDTALSKAQMRALAGPTAGGVPPVLPPIPSGIEKWIPAGAFANRTTPVGAVITTGSATIMDPSIILKLDGTTLAATPSRAGELITVQATPAQPFAVGTEHTVTVEYTDNLAGARTFSHTFTAAVFFEDFEGLALQPRKDENNAATEPFTEGWTHTPPAGWMVDNSLFPATIISPENPDDDGDGYADLDGRTEWAGWSFANKDFWVAADNQRRAEFVLAQGTAAIADPDEWDDQTHFKSLFNSFLKTPEISLAGLAANSAFLQFASSWRPEALDDVSPQDSTTGFPGDYTNPEAPVAINNQTAIVTASFDGGAPVQLMKWDSIAGSPTFKPDAPNEQILLPLNNPAGAQKVVLSFELRDGANDWWWAIDNIVVNAGAAPPLITVQPAAVEVTEGQQAQLTVTATGDNLTYQWFKGLGANKEPVSGGTAATLTFASAQVSDGGYYSVVIKNTSGEATSGEVKLTVLPTTEGALVLLEENFNALPLGPNIEEGITVSPTQQFEAVWTKTPPTGWSIDDTGVPGVGTEQDGVTEWAGWSFADQAFWANAGGQSRASFAKGTGAVAVADSDEWDDNGPAAGNMATYLQTRAISLAGVKAGSVILKFDSSWNPENPQKANVTVAFDGGTPVEVIRFESDPASPNYHPAELNESLAVAINNPAGAQNMVVTFGYFDTRNNWWWAIDNLLVTGKPAALFFEDFEGLALGPNIDEGINTTPAQTVANAWTKTPPTGWMIDDTGVPGVGTDQDGVTEWAGWSFANKEFWATAGGQNRADFTLGTGTIAVGDSDEWDDVAHAAGNMATFLTTRAIDITGRAAGTLYLTFDSSFRAENPQKASVTASFDGGPAVDVLRWVSEATSPNFRDNRNETVTLPLNNPAGATSLKLTFGYYDTRNNWWWAIDNIEVSVGAPVVNPDLAVTPIAPGGALGDVGTLANVVVDEGTKTITADLPADQSKPAFLQITPGVTITSVTIEGGKLVIKYQ